MISSIITDQISSDFEEALSIARDSFDSVEIHTIWNKTVELLTDSEIETMERLLKKYALPISCLSTTLFLMCPLYTEVSTLVPFSKTFKVFTGSLDEHMHLLEKAVSIGRRLNAGSVRVFSFRREGKKSYDVDGCIEDMAGIFSTAAAIAEKEGTRLVVENCPHTYLPLGTMTYKLAQLVGSDAFCLLYDPGNSYRSGFRDFPESYTSESVLEEYEIIKDKILHYHFKDYISEGGSYLHVPLGEGDIDFRGLYRKIATYDKPVWVSLEPEVDHPGVLRSIEFLTDIINASTS